LNPSSSKSPTSVDVPPPMSIIDPSAGTLVARIKRREISACAWNQLTAFVALVE
jgi:hypothetical protein